MRYKISLSEILKGSWNVKDNFWRFLPSSKILASTWETFVLSVFSPDEKFNVTTLLLLVVWKERDFELSERDCCL